MKHYLLRLLVILLWVNFGTSMWAADVTGALTNVASPSITYQSVDTNNRPITLSAKLYYKNNEDVEFIVLNCHATITHDAGCPTGSSPQMEAIKYLVSEKCLLICPDYIGFGETKSIVHPYMCATLTARNILDCYKAAIKYVKETAKRNIKSSYYTLNMGYSQGGATALAFQKYLETKATDADRKLVNLRGSICGAGPYDQQIVFDEYEKMESIDYPVYMLDVLKGHKAAFGKTSMRDLELSECFTPAFWQFCQDGFMAKFDAKATNVDDLNTELKKAGFTSFYSIMNSAYADPTSKVHRIIRKTLAQSNLLAEDGWTPSAQVIFYHSKATTPATGQDIVVPYACTQKAMERFAGHCSYVDAIDDYKYSVSGVNSLWHCAVFRENLPSQYGSASRFTEGIVMLAAAVTGNDSYKFSQLDHRTFGARFYAQILSLQLRPAATSTTGNAHTTNIDPATPSGGELTLEDGAAPASMYDYATMHFSTGLLPSTRTFLTFPLKVDGFAFGYNAPRWKATIADGEVVGYTPMTDSDDFEAGEVYLVAPQSNFEAVEVLEAGVTLPAKAYSPEWINLNIRSLHAFDGKSYATAYMPFAYHCEDAFTMSEGHDANTVLATQTPDIAAGTGVVLINQDASDALILEPLVPEEGGNDVVSPSLLRGTYTTIPNNGYLLFGLNGTETQVGFYLYANPEVKPYSCFLNQGSQSAGRNIIFDLSTDIEETLADGTATHEIFTLDGRRRQVSGSGINLVRNSSGKVQKVIIR